MFGMSLEMCYLPLMFSLCEQAPRGVLNLPSKGDQTRVSSVLLVLILVVNTLALFKIKACSHGPLNGFQTMTYQKDILLLQYVYATIFFITGSVEEAKNSPHFYTFCRFLGTMGKLNQINVIGFRVS